MIQPMRLLFAILLIQILSGCSTATDSTGAAGQSATTFAVIATDKLHQFGPRTYVFGFKQVDLENESFGSGGFDITLSAMGARFGDELKKPRSLRSTIRYAGKQVTSGDYALVSLTEHVTFGTSIGTWTYCYGSRAQVFRLESGNAQFMPIRNFMSVEKRGSNIPPSDEIVADHMQQLAMRHQNIASTPSLAAKIGEIHFRGSEFPNREDECQREGAVTVLSESQ